VIVAPRLFEKLHKWLFDTLLLKLKNTPDLQAILVATVPDVSLLHKAQVRLFTNPDFQKLKAEGRFNVFMLWSHEATDGAPRIIRNYVHAKSAVIDDVWATIGSANLDGASLTEVQVQMLDPRTVDYSHLAFRDLFDEKYRRSIEINVVVFDGVQGLPSSTLPSDIRRHLWAEHLGYADPNDSDLKNPPAGGWLKLWNDRAASKLDGLKQNPSTPIKSRILEWTPDANPKDQLKKLGVDVGQLKVEKRSRGFNFETGNWR
jgi:phosphatidylserine/phosphatidylglycerophosphate/cardiolipin synthase-like enzyme